MDDAGSSASVNFLLNSANQGQYGIDLDVGDVDQIRHYLEINNGSVSWYEAYHDETCFYFNGVLSVLNQTPTQVVVSDGEGGTFTISGGGNHIYLVGLGDVQLRLDRFSDPRGKCGGSKGNNITRAKRNASTINELIANGN